MKTQTLIELHAKAEAATNTGAAVTRRGNPMPTKRKSAEDPPRSPARPAIPPGHSALTGLAEKLPDRTAEKWTHPMKAKKKTQTKPARRKVCLSDLPGCPGESWALSARDEDDAFYLVSKGQLVTAAGDTGALNIYRDREGVICAEFMVWRMIKSRVETRSIRVLRHWLKTWWPQLGRDDVIAGGGQ